jgi:hypothetical protein
MNPVDPQNNLNNDFAIFTVCNLAYLPKALVLADSVLKYQHQRLKVFLFDKKVDADFTPFNIEVFWIEDLEVPNFKQLAFKYDIIEFSTSLKPFLTLRLLEEYDKVIFLDPDTCLFNTVAPILEDLEKHSIVLTPHYTTPQSNDLSESDTGMLRFGSFNLGFYAVRRSGESLYFLNWWSQRCMDLCYMDSQFGLSTDQKWVTIAPCFFKDLYVSFNLGYNIAAWNSWERKLSKDKEGNYLVNEDTPLTFFHFSNFDKKDPEYLNKRSCYETNVARPDLLEIGTWYSKELDSKNTSLASVKYAYDYMTEGEYISPTLRRAYACILPELPLNHNPFDSKGLVAQFAKKNYLFESNNESYKREGFGAVSSNKSKLTLIYFIMRLLLRFVGPNKFMNLSRLMVYLSSYRQNRGLWKY